MATYKVLQDIEAEDKLVGPLSLRQFVYAGVSALCLYFSFIVIAKGVPFLLVIFLPPAIFSGFFAFPWSRDQPTEVWALAKIRFYLKPRKRIWNQSGVKELVTITVPKKVERAYTNGLSQPEIQNRLNALANTIDSRGWATKNVSVSSYAQSLPNVTTQSDRLVDLSSLPQEVSNLDVTASDDMLDTQNNHIAQQFDTMIAASSQAHHRQIVDRLESKAPAPQPPSQPPADYWFLNQPTAGSVGAPPANTTYVKPQVVYPGADDQTPAAVPAAEPTPTEEAIIKENKQHGDPYQFAYSHLKNIHPIGSQPAQTVQTVQPQHSDDQPVTPTTDPAKIDLARNNDLNISTIARLANKKEPPENEVVVRLR